MLYIEILDRNIQRRMVEMVWLIVEMFWFIGWKWRESLKEDGLSFTTFRVLDD